MKNEANDTVGPTIHQRHLDRAWPSLARYRWSMLRWSRDTRQTIRYAGFVRPALRKVDNCRQTVWLIELG